MHTAAIGSVIDSMLRLATPLIFAATGGVISERSGVVNIALEGMLLAGAFGYFAGGYLTHSATLSVLFAVLVGVALALVLGYLSIALFVDQVIGGVAINLVALGGTGFLYRSAFGAGGLTVPGIGNVHVPGLSKLPVVGDVVFSQSILTYAAFASVILAWFVLYKTRYGVWLRATGERPGAVEAAGINVFSIRYVAVAASGFLCGLGGAFILSQVSTFTENMTAGVGFIALAAVIFGNWTPWRTLFACLLFAFFESLQTAVQVGGGTVLGVVIPYQFLLMLPYIVTIVVLAGFVGRSRPPAADGKPYIRS